MTKFISAGGPACDHTHLYLAHAVSTIGTYGTTRYEADERPVCGADDVIGEEVLNVTSRDKPLRRFIETRTWEDPCPACAEVVATGAIADGTFIDLVVDGDYETAKAYVRACRSAINNGRIEEMFA